MSGFGIYVHWPFCAAKCPYCDFNSHVRERVDETRWRDAILKELDYAASLQDVKPQVESIFFGGGTPSLMHGESTEAIIAHAAKLWSFAPNIEITLEANPNSVEQARFRDYRKAGVNRVSIGVQSLNDEALKFLGRLHGADEARKAVRLAQDIFPRASFDLIYALPGQSLSAWESELSEALEFGVTHLSLYQLTIEPGTAFATLHRQKKFEMKPDDEAAEFFERTQAMMEAENMPAYEVSNHARAGDESRHNLIYWRYGDYAGVGPGAHGRLTLAGGRVSTVSERLPENWLKKVDAAGHAVTRESVPDEDAAREHLLMNLRLSEGVDLAAYEARWNTHIARDAISHLAKEKLVALENENLRVTEKGRLVLNAVIANLLG